MVIARNMERKHLFSDTFESNGDKVLLFEQYRLYVEMADKISHRRAISNSFFLTIHTTLISFINYAVQFHESLYPLNMIGLVLTVLWFSIIRSYKNLNGAKYRIINQIEEKLLLRPYSTEWKILEQGNNKKVYWPLTHVESWVSGIFAVIYTWPLFCSSWAILKLGAKYWL